MSATGTLADSGRGDETVQGRTLPRGVGLIERTGPAHPELVGGVLVAGPDRAGVGEDERLVVRLAGPLPEVEQVAHEDALELRLIGVTASGGGFAGLGEDGLAGLGPGSRGGDQRPQRHAGDDLALLQVGAIAGDLGQRTEPA